MCLHNLADFLQMCVLEGSFKFNVNEKLNIENYVKKYISNFNFKLSFYGLCIAKKYFSNQKFYSINKVK